MKITDKELDHIETMAKIAKTVAPGPWAIDDDDLSCLAVRSAECDYICSGSAYYKDATRVISHIAAADPSTILALIERTREAERECDRLRAEVEAMREAHEGRGVRWPR